MLVLLIFVSLIQDVVWFVWNRDIDDDEDDGGLEKTVKSFSRTMSFVSFIWRVSSTLCSLFITRLQHRRCRRTFYQQFAEASCFLELVKLHFERFLLRIWPNSPHIINYKTHPLFCVQFVLAMILWKDSLDFVSIVKQKSVNRDE